ncbi:hypothetical protein DENSPDRAFT_862403 [Dentipellis sp. KUC8613]|nr:hypothetical protein DENSPDRAFT_862403 [Dentipellis sp. KUC8613]
MPSCTVRRRYLHVVLALLALILLGTVVVLSSVSYYLAIPTDAYITEQELDASANATARIPKIIHQTWKTETLPSKWKGISEECRAMMPDYEYMLWTDASSREFIAEQYPWFLDTFDSYTYPIQRADAIRYFVLHHYGGVYMDLDIGCLRPLDLLLNYPVILPRTIPVGVSNDLMFAEKGHPFMAQTIHNLVTFDHKWVLNYPTVMFSTGPMFLSAQYGIYSTAHPVTPEQPGGEVRILPKSLYGKNAKPEEAPHSFFTHFYGSSWHADDAAFIGFLGTWGKGLMWLGLAVLILGICRLIYTNAKQRKFRKIGSYDVLLPRWVERNGRWHLDLGWISLPGRLSPPASPMIPNDGVPRGLVHSSGSPEEEVSLLSIPLHMRPSSPALSDVSTIDGTTTPPHPAVSAARRVRAGMASLFGSSETEPRRPRGVLFFLPAFSSGGDITLPLDEGSARLSTSLPPSSSSPFDVESNTYPLGKRGLGLGVDIEAQTIAPVSRSGTPRPPPYSEASASSHRASTPEPSGSRRPYTNATPKS